MARKGHPYRDNFPSCSPCGPGLRWSGSRRLSPRDSVARRTSGRQAGAAMRSAARPPPMWRGDAMDTRRRRLRACLDTAALAALGRPWPASKRPERMLTRPLPSYRNNSLMANVGVTPFPPLRCGCGDCWAIGKEIRESAGQNRHGVADERAAWKSSSEAFYPESCAGGGNIAGEALTGAHTGQPLSSEIISSACRPCPDKGKATS